MTYTLTPVFGSEKMIITAHSDIYENVSITRELYPIGPDKFIIVNPEKKNKSEHIAFTLKACIDLIGSWLTCAEKICTYVDEIDSSYFDSSDVDEFDESWFR